jgi:adsorption protein A
MKPVHRQTLMAGSLLLCLNTTGWAQAEPLTDFDRSAVPYMDRSYCEAKNGNWKEVDLMRHLPSKVPENDEARALLVQSLVKQQRYEDAVQALPIPGQQRHSAQLAPTDRAGSARQKTGGAGYLQQSGARVPVQAYSASLAKRGGAARR